MDLQRIVGRAIVRLGSWMARTSPLLSIPVLLLTVLVVGPFLFIPGVAAWYDAAIDLAEFEIGDDVDKVTP